MTEAIKIGFGTSIGFVLGVLCLIAVGVIVGSIVSGIVFFIQKRRKGDVE